MSVFARQRRRHGRRQSYDNTSTLSSKTVELKILKNKKPIIITIMVLKMEQFSVLQKPRGNMYDLEIIFLYFSIKTYFVTHH